MRTYKIMLLGSGGVGKSAITFQFIQGIFINAYDPTLEDSYRKVIQLNKRYFMLEILDTAGSEHFTAMRDVHMRNGQGFVLVYSVTSPSTFYDVINIRDEIVRMKETENFPMILVGNKCDLNNERAITVSQGIALARDFGCPFIETSAKMRINISEVFHDLIGQINVTYPARKSDVLRKYCTLL